MRKISIGYLPAVKKIFIFSLILFYSFISTIYPFLPPLFGFLIAALVATDKKYFIPILIYLLFFEAQHNFVIFSSWLFVYLYKKFVLKLLNNLIVCRWCIFSLTVALSYLIYFGLNNMFQFMLGGDLINADWLIFFYHIFVEIILVVLFV